MSKTYDEVVNELNADIPRDAVKLREGGGNFKLSYLEGHYVIDRLNQVLGIGNWAYTSEVTLVHSGLDANQRYSAHYIARVRLAVKLPNMPDTEFCDYGYGDGMDRNSPGKPHELAVKEAVTDGLKRCAKNLGMSMGLALYDKTQEHVADAPVQAKAAPATAVTEDKSKYVNSVRVTSRVAIKKGKTTLEGLQGYMKEKFGVDNVDLLPYKQLIELDSYLKGVVNG